ncbi:type II secretion system secretin GspD [Pinisolibacter sp.]|uniref:type II secretion system secretin GspD n=1 Tax=Pinisolibacter sp. TaxID=2172024 RepID=UPI002FDE9C55
MIRHVAAICIALLLASCSDLERRELGVNESAPDGVFSQDLRARFGNNLNQPHGSGASVGGSVPAAQVYHGASEAFASGAPGVRVNGGGDSYDLNFENTDVAGVSKVVLGDILGMTYTIDPRVSGPISLSSARPVAKRDLLPLYESALKIANAVLVKEGPLHKVMPAGEVSSGGGIDDGRRLEPGFGLTVLPLRWVSAQAVVRTLDSFAARPGSIRADAARNLLVIQGTATERASALDTALALDVDFMKNQSVGVFPVANVAPDAVVSELQNIFDAGKEGGGQDAVRFQSMPRLNAILAVARTPTAIDRVRTWIARLDRSDFGDSSLRVYRLKYGNAKVIAGLLREVFGGQGGGSASDAGSSSASALSPGSETRRSSSSASGGGFGSGGSGFGSSSSSGGGMFSRADLRGFGKSADGTGDGTGQSGTSGGSSGSALAALGEGRGGGSGAIRITADVANNTILVSAPREQYKLIERAIQEMDTAPVQVAIEATIAEVTLKNELQYGVQFFLRDKSGSAIGFNSGSSQPIAKSLPGFNAILGPGSNPRVIINGLKALTDVKVLSSPSLVVVNNQVASLEVGDQVPITTRTATSTENPLAPTVNSIDYRDTGVILRVLPRVAANGAVNLEVEQEVSNVVGTTTTTSDSGTLTPTIAQRRIKSAVTVMSGQTVVLGGLIGSRQEKSRSGLPFLGNLANSLQNGHGTTNTEIIVFIRPQVVRDSVDAQAVSEELRNKLQLLRRGVGGPTVVRY